MTVYLVTKISVTFFVGIELLNIFRFTVFSRKKKNNIFQNNREKLFLGA